MGYQDRDWYKDEMKKRNVTTRKRVTSMSSNPNVIKTALIVSITLNVILGYAFLDLAGFIGN